MGKGACGQADTFSLSLGTHTVEGEKWTPRSCPEVGHGTHVHVCVCVGGWKWDGARKVGRREGGREGGRQTKQKT